MTGFKAYWIYAIAAVCTVVTLGLLLWPETAPPAVATPRADGYAGPVFQMQSTTRAQTSVLQLASERQDATPAPTVPTPALVGIIGRSVYLRSASTGETTRVTINQEMDGWRVIAVGSRTATLRGASGDQRLELFSAAKDETESSSLTSPAVGG